MIAYVLVTGVLGVAFLVVGRRTAPRTPTDAPLRVGGFTGASRTASAAPSAPSALIPADAPALGASAERVRFTIVEFSSFQCPYCRAAFPTIRAAVASRGDRGLRYVYRHFFDDALHPFARSAAEAAACAGQQGKFWAYHDKLFQNQERLDPASLARYGREVGLDVGRFDACVRDRVTRTVVDRDVADGTARGVRGTPTWFLVVGANEGATSRVEGVIPADALDRLLDRFLP